MKAVDALQRTIGTAWEIQNIAALPRLAGGLTLAAGEAISELGERGISIASRLQRLARVITTEVESYRTFRYLKQTHPEAVVELYHYTSGKAAQEIMASGFLRGGRGLWRLWASEDVYFSVYPNAPGWLLKGVYMLEPAKTQVVIPVRLPLKEVIWRPFGIRIVPGPVPIAAGY